jgi:8-oxo-dGTP pyrophosphatase MutT (NUDIX family)
MGYMEELRSLIGHRCVILNGSVTVLRDEAGRVLLQHRDDGRWGLPGGLMELGESCEETARRETKEETGLDLGGLTLLGVWSGKDFFCRARNGDEFYAVTTAFLAEDWSGALKAPDAESLDFAWAELSALPENLAASHRRILTERREAIEKGETPCDSYPGT